ncbi:MAG TPA: hypothetical protein VF062_15325 [Candidatus Limnocylindrales bacterium]
MRSRFGAELDIEDQGSGRLLAHAALGTTEWVLESFGHKEILPSRSRPDTAESLAAEHRRKEQEWYHDDDARWPLPVTDYVTLIESVLGVDFEALPEGQWRPALARFGAPTTELMVGGIRAQTDFGYNDPDSWLIQHRIGGPIDDDTVDLEIDRFIDHWDWERHTPTRWHEVDRGEAVVRLIYVQRESLLFSRNQGWDPGEKLARMRADDFLYPFPKATRFFTNSRARDSYSFRITPYTLDTGVIAFSEEMAGIWWRAEDD